MSHIESLILFFLSMFFLTFFVGAAFVPDVRAEEYIMDEPVCFRITNEEDQRVYGHIETAMDPDTQQRYRSEFRLEAGETAAACTVGPFFEGRRVWFVIKTLMPLFACKTSIYQPIVIKREKFPNGQYKKDKTGRTIWAECY